MSRKNLKKSESPNPRSPVFHGTSAPISPQKKLSPKPETSRSFPRLNNPRRDPAQRQCSRPVGLRVLILNHRRPLVPPVPQAEGGDGDRGAVLIRSRDRIQDRRNLRRRTGLADRRSLAMNQESLRFVRPSGCIDVRARVTVNQARSSGVTRATSLQQPALP